MKSATDAPVTAVILLDCGCYYGKAKRERKDHWHLCDQAQILLWHWQHSRQIADHDNYQNHFNEDSSTCTDRG